MNASVEDGFRYGISKAHMPAILISVAVTLAIKTIMFRWIIKSCMTSPNAICVLHMIVEVQKSIAFSVCSAIVVFDIVTTGSFHNRLSCHPIRLFIWLFTFSVVYGGIPISIMRTLMTTCRDTIIRKIGENVLLTAIIFVWQTMLVGSVIVAFFNKTPKIANGYCQQLSVHFSNILSGTPDILVLKTNNRTVQSEVKSVRCKKLGCCWYPTD